MQEEFNFDQAEPEAAAAAVDDGFPCGAQAPSYNRNMKLYSSTQVPLGLNIHIMLCVRVNVGDVGDEQVHLERTQVKTPGDAHRAFEDTSAQSLCITYGNVFALGMHESIVKEA